MCDACYYSLGESEARKLGVSGNVHAGARLWHSPSLEDTTSDYSAEMGEDLGDCEDLTARISRFLFRISRLVGSNC
jgi:hypothetical protein